MRRIKLQRTALFKAVRLGLIKHRLALDSKSVNGNGNGNGNGNASRSLRVPCAFLRDCPLPNGANILVLIGCRRRAFIESSSATHPTRCLATRRDAKDCCTGFQTSCVLHDAQVVLSLSWRSLRLCERCFLPWPPLAAQVSVRTCGGGISMARAVRSPRNGWPCHSLCGWQIRMQLHARLSDT